MSAVTVVGAGLAGSECAWQLARRGIKVRLVEMKPGKYSPAHVSPGFAELVCSNSLRSDELTNAVGLLKEELRRLGSLIMESADKNRVAAGGALAVDREGFSEYITQRLRACPNVEVEERELTEIPEGEAVIATGPLTSDAMAEASCASVRSSTCTSTTPWPPSSRWRAWTWKTPTSPRATARVPQIM